MVTTGFCESCGGRVALNEDYSCTNGHPASQVHNIQGSEIAEPTWAVGSDGKQPQRRLPGSSLMLVVGMLLAATVVGISVATVLGNASARRAMVSRPTQVLVAAAPAPSSPISFVSTGSTSVQATIATHGTNPVDTTNAMAPTIVSGQRYTSGKRTTRINVGDIVYFRSKTGSRLVRRVAGLGGDSMSLSEGWVYRNGQSLNEPYVRYNDARFIVGAMLVPEGAVFVIGDNRNHLSSQFWGLVTVADIQGVVTP